MGSVGSGRKMRLDTGMNALIIKHLEEAGGSAEIRLSKFSTDNGFSCHSAHDMAARLKKKGILEMQYASGNCMRLTLIKEVLDQYRRGETPKRTVTENRNMQVRATNAGRPTKSQLPTESVLNSLRRLKKLFGNEPCAMRDVNDLMAAAEIVAKETSELETERVSLEANISKLSEAARGLGADETDLSFIGMEAEAKEKTTAEHGTLPNVPFIDYSELLSEDNKIPDKAFKLIAQLQRETKQLRNAVLDNLQPAMAELRTKQTQLENYLRDLQNMETPGLSAAIADWKRASDKVVAGVNSGVAVVSSKV